jgi:hypothetical protein
VMGGALCMDDPLIVLRWTCTCGGGLLLVGRPCLMLMWHFFLGALETFRQLGVILHIGHMEIGLLL